MTNPLIAKLTTLAYVVQQQVREDISGYAPKLVAQAHEIEVKMDAWLTAVDEHLEDWGSEALGAAKSAAFAAYREAVSLGRELHAEVSSRLR